MKARSHRDNRSLLPLVLVGLLPIAPIQSASAQCTIPGDPEAGKSVYEDTCIACHGDDGRGIIAGFPDLTEKGGPLSKPDDVLLSNIAEGFESGDAPMAMPPKGGNPDLSSEDIQNVLGYMRREFTC